MKTLKPPASHAVFLPKRFFSPFFPQDQNHNNPNPTCKLVKKKLFKDTFQQQQNRYITL